jgi:thiol-disulfide isomerase/thioredoxin
MSSKSIIASWRTWFVALGLVLLVIAGYGLIAQEDAGRAETVAEVGEAPDRVTRELSTGTLTAFVVHPEPKPVGDIAFDDAEGTPLTLAEWRDRVVLVNLWATWCGPCREEMPALAELQRQLGSQDFEVVAISLDRQGAEVAQPFLEDVGAEALELYLDPSTKVLAAFRAVGLPASILIDRSGREVGRMFGPADWASPEAIRLINAALAEDGTS